MQEMKTLPKDIQEQILCETLNFYTFPILYSEFKHLIKTKCRNYLILHLHNSHFYKYSQDPELPLLFLKDFDYALNWKLISKHHILSIAFFKEFLNLLDFDIISKRTDLSLNLDALVFIKNKINWSIIPLNPEIIRNFSKLIPLYRLIDYSKTKLN